MSADAGTELDAGLAVGQRPDRLDPGEVYLLGELSEGECRTGALAHWSTPNVPSVGFDCYLDGWSATIRPDGRLLYVKTAENLLREYQWDPWDGGVAPENPYENDPLVRAPCPGAAALSRFLVSADGAALFLCADESSWRDQSGARVYQHPTDDLVAAGAAGWALTETRVVNLGSGAEYFISGLAPDTWITVRWAPPDAFFIVTLALDERVLWRVSLTGLAQRIGSYPELTHFNFAGAARLDRTGRIFELGTDTTVSPSSLVDVIVRREIGGSAEVVYTEASSPLVKAHASTLVTGP